MASGKTDLWSALSPPQKVERGDARRPVSRGDLVGYTRDAANEISLRFPKLANPTIVLYVFPHLADDRVPVPGYSTTFPLYERDEFALPGERPGR